MKAKEKYHAWEGTSHGSLSRDNSLLAIKSYCKLPAEVLRLFVFCRFVVELANSAQPREQVTQFQIDIVLPGLPGNFVKTASGLNIVDSTEANKKLGEPAFFHFIDPVFVLSLIHI